MRPAARALLALLLSLVLFGRSTASAEHPPLFDRLETALQTKNQEMYLGLFAEDPLLLRLEKKSFEDYLAFQPVRTVLHLVDADEERMRVHILIQAEEEARFESWSMEIGVENGRQVILTRDIISTVEGLYRLRMSPAVFPVRNLEILHADARILLRSGSVLPITASGELVGALFLGTGTFSLAPSDRTEQQQINLFCGKPAIETNLQHLYIRASQKTIEKFFGDVLAGQPAPDAALYEHAQEITSESDRNAFGVRLPFSDELWFPRLQTGDIYSEIKTDLGTLVYQYAPNEQEDILLADKDRDHIVSLYSSRGPGGGRANDPEDFRVLSYKMDLTFSPGNQHLAGTAETLLSSRYPTTSVIFKLNPSLRVTNIESSQGSLLYFQEKSTNNLHVVLNEMVDEGTDIRLRFHYEGEIQPDKGRSEVQTIPGQGDTEFFLPPTFLYSNQSIWYPQLLSKPYSQVQTTVEVPDGYSVVSNGQLVRFEEHKDRSVFSYSSDLPVKYFSMLVGRLRGTLTKDSVVPLRVYYYSIDKSNASKQLDNADKILRYYTDYFGRYPYRNMSLALRPSGEPGGHAPAGFIITNRVFSFLRMRFERDPLYIPAYPDFLLAHEVAHQWWGQGVGWRSYHDQWLSEGFAQFAASEYIRSIYGDKAWIKLSTEFRDWIHTKTSAGPIILGSRLGHITNDARAYSALMYNKGAYVLNMLKLWLGEEAFRKSLQEFFELYRFKLAGIEDFERIAQSHTLEDLKPFFEQWLYGWTIPQVTWSWNTDTSTDETLLRVRFRQAPDDAYNLRVPVEVRDRGGQAFRFLAVVDAADREIEIPIPFTPATVVVDPLNENLADYTQAK